MYARPLLPYWQCYLYHRLHLLCGRLLLPSIEVGWCSRGFYQCFWSTFSFQQIWNVLPYFWPSPDQVTVGCCSWLVVEVGMLCALLFSLRKAPSDQASRARLSKALPLLLILYSVLCLFWSPAVVFSFPAVTNLSFRFLDTRSCPLPRDRRCFPLFFHHYCWIFSYDLVTSPTETYGVGLYSFPRSSALLLFPWTRSICPPQLLSPLQLLERAILLLGRKIARGAGNC